MDITQILGILSGGKKNPVITNFVEDLKSSVAKLEDK